MGRGFDSHHRLNLKLMERDRLKKKLRRKAIQNTIFVILGLGVIAFLLLTFGAQLLINFSLLLGPKGNSTYNTTDSQGVNYIATPDLNPMETATNSAKINVSGTSSVDKSTVKLYVNGILADTTKVNEKNEFNFRNISVDQGDNEIKAKIISPDGKESDFSAPQTITYTNKAPDLSIDYPQDGQTLKDDQQTLHGKTSAGAKVTVNGFWAIVDDQGNFSYNIKLQNGDNTMKLEAVDDAGNKTSKEIKVNYSP
jgi:hypothetical protein